MAPWYEEAEFYHIYPIGLTGAPRKNESEETVHRFSTLEQWLPHIADLGCTAIYIGPLFESTTHGYDTKDYKQVDRRLGDNADFAAYVKKAHELGIKVVVDGVFNHTGREFFAFRDIQEKREQSPYCGWYKGIWFGGNTCYNDGFSYEAWRNCFELVNLNLQNQQVRDYLLDVIDFWIDEFDIDGIRLDCADCLDFGFMEQMRARTSAKKQDFWLMGEVIHGDYARYIGDGQHLLHSVTNYELHKGLYSGHNDHNYFEIAHTIRREFDENGGIYKGKKLYSFVPRCGPSGQQAERKRKHDSNLCAAVLPAGHPVHLLRIGIRHRGKKRRRKRRSAASGAESGRTGEKSAGRKTSGMDQNIIRRQKKTSCSTNGKIPRTHADQPPVCLCTPG